MICHFARRSFRDCCNFRFSFKRSVSLLGDESGYELGDVQKPNSLQLKQNGIHTEPVPAVYFYLVFETKEMRPLLQLKFHMSWG